MPHFTKKLSQYLIAALVLAQFLLFVSGGALGKAESQISENSQSKAATESASLPPFPEDAKRPEVDWSRVDWDREIILPKDEEEYYKEVAMRAEFGRAGEIQDITLKVSHLYDEEIMRMYRVPAEIQRRVIEYRQAIAKNPSRQEAEKARLQKAIQELTDVSEISAKQTDTQETLPQQILNIKDAKLLDEKKFKLVPSNSAPDDFQIKVKELNQRAAAQGSMFQDATTDTIVPLITYYEGIENHTVEHLLYYLSQRQNSDGSFGAYSQYEITAELAFLFSKIGVKNNDQYALMLSYLQNAAAGNTREKALKARALASLNQPYQALLDSIIAGQNADGGFGIDENHESDLQTTLEVMRALYETNYTIVPSALFFAASRVQSNGTIIARLGDNPSYYLINKTLEYLKPFKTYVVSDGTTTIKIQDKINAMIGFLAGEYSESTSTFANQYDLVDELMTLYSFQLYGRETAKQSLLWTSVNSQQNSDGSFGDSLYGAIAALKTLPQGDLIITSITPVGDLINYSPAAWDVVIENKGYDDIALNTLYSFFDGYQLALGSSLNVILSPNESAEVEFTIQSTSGLIGATNIAFYIEAEGDKDFENNWMSSQVTFASESTGKPALPLYYIATKYDIDGNPAMNIRVSQKPDPNRVNYVALFRPKGTTTWSYMGIPDGWNGFFLSSFPEDAIYEVTTGALNQARTSITYATNITEITLSADPKKYTGNANGTITFNNTALADTFVASYGNSADTDETGAFSFVNAQNGANAAWADEVPYEKYITKFPVPVGGTTSDIRLFTRLKPDATLPSIQYAEVRFESDYRIKNQQTVSLIAVGSDNTAIKEGDFYYYDPSFATWVYIGTIGAVNSTQVQTDWYVPETLSGTGYILQAILYDYQGNASIPAQWGPFEIVSGAAPTGAVDIIGLQNNAWNIGATKTISWNIQGPHPLTQIDLRLYYGSKVRFIGNGQMGSTTFTYAMPFDSALASASAFVRASLRDAEGSSVDIDSAPFSIIDNTPPPPPPWGAEQPFPITLSGYNLWRGIEKIFHNPDGSIEIIYTEYDGLYYEDPPGESRRIVYRKFAASVWQNPVVLKEYRYGAGDRDNRVSFNTFDLVKAANGDIHIAYQAGVGGGLSELDSTEIYYLHSSGGTLVAEKRISNDTTSSSYPKIAVRGSDGRVFIAWSQGYSYVARSGTSTLRFMEGDGFSSWNGEMTLTNVPSGATQLIVENNEPTVLYRIRNQDDNFTYTYQSRQSGNWGTPLSITTASSIHPLYTNFFQAGSNLYDLFFMRYDQNLAYDVYHVRFSMNGGSAVIVKEGIAVDREQGDDIRLYSVLPRGNGEYHIAYIRSEPWRNNSIKRAYYTLYDGVQNYFTSRVSPLALYLEETSFSIANNQDIATIYYVRIDGAYSYTQGNFRSRVGYRLNPVYPAHGSVNVPFSGALEWNYTGGAFSSFDVLFGTDRNYVSAIATGVAGTSFTLPQLAPQTTYYWQIVGNTDAEKIYSSLWRFTTGDSEPEIEIAGKNGVLEINGKFNFGAVTIGSSASATFTIKNIGSADLLLNGAPIVDITGTHASEFKVTTHPEAIIPKAGSSDAIISFEPKTKGMKSATLLIASNDTDENPYTIILNGPAGGSNPDDYLVAHWKLDEGAGTIANDASGNGNNGAIQGGAEWTTGVSGGALNLDGVDDYASKSLPSFIDDTQGSVSLWARFDNNTQLSTFWSASVDGASDDEMYVTYWGNDNDSIRVELVQNDQTVMQLRSEPSMITDTKFHHIVVTSDGFVLKLYIDGVEKTLVAYTGNNAGQWFDDATQADVFTLGAIKKPQPYAMDGTLDDVRIYNAALSEAQIATLYRDFVAPEIHIKQGTQDRLNNAVIDLGIVDVGSSTDLTFDIYNKGNGDLKFTSVPPVTLSGPNKEDIVLITQPSNTITSGASSSVTLRFAPTSPGVKAAHVIITSNDMDENSYLLIITATVQDFSLPRVMSGYAWSSSVGWISFSCANREAATGKTCLDANNPSFNGDMHLADYRAAIDRKTGALSGYAWNDHVGWISFNRDDSGNPPAAPYNESVSLPPSSALESYWNFDNGAELISSKIAKDGSGNGNDGILVGGQLASDVVAGVSGTQGSALNFDGVNDYASKSSPSFIDNTQGTVSVWVKFDVLETNEVIWGSSVDGVATDEFLIYLRPGNSLRVRLNLGGITSMDLDTSANVITDTNWHYVVVTSDGGTIRMYIDAVEKTLTSSTGTNGGQWFASAINADLFALGALKEGAATVIMDGALDELRIYSTPLTPEEVQTLYKTPSGIVHEGDAIAYMEGNENDATRQITGWARALMGKTANWDGWIKLSGKALDGTPYGLSLNKDSSELTGWMYGGDVLGWISANCKNRNTCVSAAYNIQIN